MSVLLAIGIRTVGYIESFNELRAEANSASYTADSSGTLLAHLKEHHFLGGESWAQSTRKAAPEAELTLSVVVSAKDRGRTSWQQRRSTGTR
jgi:hypothetical protein